MWYTASTWFLGLLCGTHRWWTLCRCFHTLSTRVNACCMGNPPQQWFSVCIWTQNYNIMSQRQILTLLSKDIYIFGRYINFFGADNFSDGFLAIEHSLPRFATLVPVHALDVLFQKARFQKLVLLLTNDGMRNLDVWTTWIETGMFHLRGTSFMKEALESDR